jgi:aflatoxin B1 aldehyde reductase
VRAPPRERAREAVDRARSGGFFAGKVPSEAATAELEAGSRFAGSSAMAQLYRGRYVRGGYFRALELVKAAAVRRPRRAPRCAGC